MLTALLSLSRSLSLTCYNYCVHVLYVRMYVCTYMCTYTRTYVSVASINSVVLHVTYCVFSYSKIKKFLIGDS